MSIPAEPDDDALVRQVSEGDEGALAQLFDRHRGRLKRMVELRLNRKLQGRVDASDVVQDACVDASRMLDEFLRDRPMPFFLWLRHITSQRLIDAHRRHLGVQKRNAGQEISLDGGLGPLLNSASLAAQLLGGLTSPSAAAVRAELRLRVQDALNELDPLDREILALRHFEQLSNAETAEALGLNRSTASSRYLRALKRIGERLDDV